MQEAFNLCTSLLQLLSTEDHYQAQENPMGTTSVRSKISGLIHGSKLMTIVINVSDVSTNGYAILYKRT